LSHDINPQLYANLLEHGKETPIEKSQMKNRTFPDVGVRDGKSDRERTQGNDLKGT